MGAVHFASHLRVDDERGNRPRGGTSTGDCHRPRATHGRLNGRTPRVFCRQTSGAKGSDIASREVEAFHDWEAHMATLRLLHVMTVPISLFFLHGQGKFLRRLRLKEHAISSPGPGLVRFSAEGDIA